MVQAIERYMKQAIVDRNPSVASAALVSAMVSTMEHHHVHEYHISIYIVYFKQRR